MQKPVFFSTENIMAADIRNSFRRSFITFARVLALASSCAGAGFVIVWPLWKFATAAPVPYTAAVLCISSSFIIWRIVKAVRASSWKSALRVIIHTAVIVLGTAGAVLLVFSGHRFLAIPVLLLIPVLPVHNSWRRHGRRRRPVRR